MSKIIYGFIILFSMSAFAQNYKFSFSSHYPVTIDSKGDYTRCEEKIEGLFFFGLSEVDFELKGNPVEKLDFFNTSFDDEHQDIYEMVSIYSCKTPAGTNFHVKLYQFLDRRIQVFSSYEGKNYLYIIDKAIAEDGTVYAVRT